MRGMSAIVGIVLLSLMGASCGGTAPVDPVGGDDDDFTLPDGDTADTAVAEGFDPVAVGFELISGIDGNGGLVNFTQNANEYPPQVLVTFAGLAYFETGDDSETCTIIGLWAPEPRATPLPVNGSEGQVNLYHSYEEPLFFEMDTNTCSNIQYQYLLQHQHQHLHLYQHLHLHRHLHLLQNFRVVWISHARRVL